MFLSVCLVMVQCLAMALKKEGKEGGRNEERKGVLKNLEGQREGKKYFFYFLFSSFTEIYLRYSIIYSLKQVYNIMI